MQDIRDVIFKDILDKKFRALISTEKDGCLSGVEEAQKVAAEIGVSINFYYEEGDLIKAGDIICEIIGYPKQITIAEDKIIGCLSKFSGIATAAHKAVLIADGKIRIVSGSLKKMPSVINRNIRKALESGGAYSRISTTPMVYMDKNYIKMLGSIPNALEAAKCFDDLAKVIQIKGDDVSIEQETTQALKNGCNILMVDTGNLDDLKKCIQVTEELNKRKDVQIAFAGGIKLEQIPNLIEYGIDALCVGKDIVDALLLDMKLDVQI